MHNHYIKQILDIPDSNIIIDKISDLKDTFLVDISSDVTSNSCPKCNKETTKTHDQRVRIFKHGVSNGRKMVIHYCYRRYRCSCGCNFPESNSFITRYSKISILTKN